MGSTGYYLLSFQVGYSLYKILKEAKKIIMKDCGCRAQYKNCENPRDLCIGLNNVADEILEKSDSKARVITVQEALDALALVQHRPVVAPIACLVFKR